MPSSLIWDIGFLAATAALCGAYSFAARTVPDLKLPRNFAFLLMAGCIGSNAVTILLPYPESIKLFAPMDLASISVVVFAIWRRWRGRLQPLRWLGLLRYAFLVMCILHAALWGPHLFDNRPTKWELDRYFVILNVLYAVAFAIVAFPGGRHAYGRIRSYLPSRRNVAFQPLTRL